jgi:DNA-binding NarL/FixJ family response regulator
MRVVIADDEVLLREGLASLLVARGHEVAALAGDAVELCAAVGHHLPDLAIVDVRMPPTRTDEGARAAIRLRIEYPQVGVLVLSQTVAVQQALYLAEKANAGFGYLLKDRVLHVDEFLDAAARVAAGGSAIDPKVVAHLLKTAHEDVGTSTALGALSNREVDVLKLVAEGRTNSAIATALFLTERTVESHVRAVFGKLGLSATRHDHRRVLAVLAYITKTGYVHSRNVP